MDSKVLNEHLKGVADAIRAKKGTSELINPQDFAEEISTISGGSGEGDGSTIEYFAYDANVPVLVACAIFAQHLRAEAEGQIVIVGPSNEALGRLMAGLSAEIVAFGIDFNERMVVKQGDLRQESTILDTIIQNGISREEIESLPRITKEEFYHISHDGAYIQHIDGTLYTAYQWTNGGFSNDEANGIAIIDEAKNIHFVVAKDSLGEMQWSSMPDTLIEGITTTTNKNEAGADRTGVENTTIIAAADPNSAAAACANYTFPNGQKGYLISPLEGTQIYLCENLIKPIAQSLGMTWPEDMCWTTVQYDATTAWYVRIAGMLDTHLEPKTKNLVVRPVCTLENYKFPTA